MTMKKGVFRIALAVCLIALTCVFALTGCEELMGGANQGGANNGEHVHTVVVDKAVEPTCTEPGLTKGRHCSECDEVLLAQEVVDPTGHTEVTDDAVPPTCTETGLTEGKHCSVCNEVLVKQDVVPAGHNVVDDLPVDPTCTENGLTAGKHCSLCGEVFLAQEPVSKLGHIEIDSPAVAPTCTEPGLTAGTHCTRCDKDVIKQWPVDALGHIEVITPSVSATCTTPGKTEGKHCDRCGDTLKVQENVNALGHNEVIDPAVAPTCTTFGLTEGKHCERCGTVTVVQQEVAKANHTYDDEYDETCNKCGFIRDAACAHTESTVVKGYDSTCKATGLTDGTKCAKCEQILTAQEVIPLKPHTEVVDPAVASTCSSYGKTEGKHCSVCNEITVPQQNVELLPHTEETVPGTPATCTTYGKSDGKKCTVCGKITVAQKTLNKTSHNQDIVIPAIPATCTEYGKTEGKNCSACGTVVVAQKTVNKAPHTEEEIPAVEATCTATGKTAGIKCSVCDEIILAQTTVNLKPHTEVSLNKVDATCTTTGLTAGKKCSVCNTVTVAQDNIPALGHVLELAAVSGGSASCGMVCTRCSYVDRYVTYLTYEEFGAVGNGTTDDSEAIRATHNAANKFGLPVQGRSDATYYIGAITQTIVIKTSTDWNGATFIFDDSQIMWNDTALRSVNIFTVTHDDQYLYYDVTVPTALQTNGLAKGATKIEGLNLSAPAMILIQNSNERIFKRYGVNADNGDAMQEILYVDKDGNIIGTPVQYDYSTITSIRVYSVTDTPISVGNANVKTIVPNPKAQDPNYENNYCFFNRGIVVRRSNTTIYNITHTIEGEDMSVKIDRNGDGTIDYWGADKSYGVPYNGFFWFEYSYNVQFKDSQVQGHQAYNFYQDGDTSKRNEMGSYDIYAHHCVNLQFNNITQREGYGEYASDTVITNRFMYHGVMGSYYCRNVVMDNCYLDRFDSHKGLHSATITNSTLGFGILVIGGGDLYIENVYRPGNRDGEDHFIVLRHDYNSVFDGTLTIKNCRMGPNVKSIVNGVWRSFDCGLPNYMFRSITIDGLTVEAKGVGFTYNVYLYNVSGASTDAVNDSVNKLYLPTSVSVSGLKKEQISGSYTGIKMNASKNDDAFQDVM